MLCVRDDWDNLYVVEKWLLSVLCKSLCSLCKIKSKTDTATTIQYLEWIWSFRSESDWSERWVFSTWSSCAFTQYLNILVFLCAFSCGMKLNLDYLLETLWEYLALICIFTKKRGGAYIHTCSHWMRLNPSRMWNVRLLSFRASGFRRCHHYEKRSICRTCGEFGTHTL